MLIYECGSSSLSKVLEFCQGQVFDWWAFSNRRSSGPSLTEGLCATFHISILQSTLYWSFTNLSTFKNSTHLMEDSKRSHTNHKFVAPEYISHRMTNMSGLICWHYGAEMMWIFVNTNIIYLLLHEDLLSSYMFCKYHITVMHMPCHSMLCICLRQSVM